MMSSVQGEKKCPQCGGTMFYDFNCNTTEEVRTCLRCGFYQNWFLLRNEAGSVKAKEDGTWLGGYEEKTGYGAVSLMSKTGVGQVYALNAPLSDADKEAILKDFQCEDVESASYVVLYDPKSDTFTALAGMIPGAYEDGEQ